MAALQLGYSRRYAYIFLPKLEFAKGHGLITSGDPRSDFRKQRLFETMVRACVKHAGAEQSSEVPRPYRHLGIGGVTPPVTERHF